MNFESLSKRFPILKREINGNRLVYLDNAATTQKPRRVINALNDFYSKHNANIHRGLHTLSIEASEMYEDAHERAAQFIGADGIEEIIFTRNTTESLNLIVEGWGRKFLKKGDVVVISEMEHHSNIVPWQILEEDIGINLMWVEVNEDGLVDVEDYKRILKKNKKRVKVVSTVHISNVLGTVNPAKQLAQLAHEAGAIFILDAAQSAARFEINVKDMDVDFLALSSHKMYGPTGIGVLYGRKELLEEMRPWMGGGDMISRVTKDLFEVNELPWKFEAGTPNIADGAVFAEAIEFLDELGMENIVKHEKELITYGYEQLSNLDFVEVLGPRDIENRMGVLAFSVEDVHPHDLSSLLNEDGIAIRAGHHCAMPLHIRLQIPASARASLAVYNKKEDIDLLVESIKNARSKFI
jgi:cysteine desulfurase/selenocysteine lyase